MDQGLSNFTDEAEPKYPLPLYRSKECALMYMLIPTINTYLKLKCFCFYIKYTQIFSIFYFTIEIGGLHNPLKVVYFKHQYRK